MAHGKVTVTDDHCVVGSIKRFVEAKTMTTIRVTRPNSYPVGSIGHTDHTARQGHYYRATSPEEALAKATSDFPLEPLDVQEKW